MRTTTPTFNQCANHQELKAEIIKFINDYVVYHVFINCLYQC